MKTTYCGIDPGISGAIALIDSDGLLIYAEDLPVVDGRLSSSLLDQWFEDLAPITPDWVYIEQVHSMPKMGVRSMFTFGHTLGVIEGVVGARRLRSQLVTPTQWKRHMGVTSDKDTSRARALELWPDQADRFRRKKDADRAEAALIAEYGRLTKG
jgi:hypothetical protein